MGSKSEMEKLYAFFTEFELQKITLTTTDEPPVIKGDKR
jgi:hypothetical protein